MARRNMECISIKFFCRSTTWTRSREFYTKTLGFKLLHDFSPEYLAVITANKLQIGFYPPNYGSFKASKKDRSVGIEFEVDSVDAWYRKLRKRGIKFVEKPKSA